MEKTQNSIDLEMDMVEKLKQETSIENLMDFIDKLWEEIIRKYKQDLHIINFDHSIKNPPGFTEEQFKIAIFSNLFLTLSTVSTEFYRGVPKFLKATQMDSLPKNDLTYTDANSFQTFLRHQKPCTLSQYTDTIILANPTAESKVDIFSPTKQSDLIEENTPLHRYIDTHFYDKHNIAAFKDLYGSDYNDKVESSNFFSNESRYFLSVVLKAASKGISPYTMKTYNGISLKSLNSLFNKLSLAYHSKNVQSPLEYEWLLFLLYTEEIYRPTFLYSVFCTFRELFKEKGSENIPCYIHAINIIYLIKDLPLPALQLHIWEMCCEILKNQAPIEQKLIQLNSLKNDLSPQLDSLSNFTDEIEKHFSEWLILQVQNISKQDKHNYAFSKSKRNTSKGKAKESYAISRKKLKKGKDILYYYLNSNRSKFSWSRLESNNSLKVPSIFHEYFDFYTSYVFYIPNKSYMPNQYPILTDFYTPGFGINSYLNFIFSIKR